MEAAGENPQKRRKLVHSNRGDIPLNGDVLEVLYVKFISACNMPLRLVECPEFRAFLHYLNPDTDHWLPGAHKTVRGWVMRQFGIERTRIQQQVLASKTKVHLSLDIWTSPNNKPIMGVIAHYILASRLLEKLAMKEIEGEHTGVNLGPYVMQVIKDWELSQKLGYIVMDNAPNNYTMMQYVSEGLSLTGFSGN